MNYYGVTQFCHGAEHRWIFDEMTLQGILGDKPIPTDGDMDILWPIGGSNSSVTSFELLENDDEIHLFLIGATDLGDDCLLCDISEYYLTVETDCGSCTEEFIEKFDLDSEELDKTDDCFYRCERMESMIAELTEYESHLSELDALSKMGFAFLDEDNLCFSDLCEIYNEFLQKKESFDFWKNAEIDDIG